MRRLRAALAACALAAVPVALLAQQTQQSPPNVRTIPPVTRANPHPRPGASGAYAHHNNGRSTNNPYASTYPVVIDGTVMNRFLATPSPKPKRTPATRTPYGEQVFETHSTDSGR